MDRAGLFVLTQVVSISKIFSLVNLEEALSTPDFIVQNAIFLRSTYCASKRSCVCLETSLVRSLRAYQSTRQVPHAYKSAHLGCTGYLTRSLSVFIWRDGSFRPALQQTPYDVPPLSFSCAIAHLVTPPPLPSPITLSSTREDGGSTEEFSATMLFSDVHFPWVDGKLRLFSAGLSFVASGCTPIVLSMRSADAMVDSAAAGAAAVATMASDAGIVEVPSAKDEGVVVLLVKVNHHNLYCRSNTLAVACGHHTRLLFG